MKMIEPAQITEANILTSSVPESGTWDAGTAYAEGDEVELVSTHRRYRAAVAHSGQDPATDNGSHWIEMGASNRYRPFDGALSQNCISGAPITYRLAVPTRVTAMGLLGVVGNGVTVRVYDPNDLSTPLWERSVELVDDSSVVDWYSFFDPNLTFQPDFIIEDIPGFTAQVIEVEINSGAADAQVSEITLGLMRALGETLDRTSLSIRDYSVLDTDDFGRQTTVERGFARNVDFRVATPTGNERAFIDPITRVRAKPALFYADQSALDRGAYAFGIARLAEIPLAPAAWTEWSLQITGVVQNG